MAGLSTTPPTDEPYQVFVEGPRICNLDPLLMREFTAVVRCNRDGVEYPFTADVESVLRQHINRHFVCELCTREHGSKRDLDTHISNDHKGWGICPHCNVAFPDISALILHVS